MELNELMNNEMCCDLIIESVRYYSIYHFEIREFLRTYGKKRMMQEIRDTIKYDDVENEIMELIHYIVRNPYNETSSYFIVSRISCIMRFFPYVRRNSRISKW